jgi:hypothetical protein
LEASLRKRILQIAYDPILLGVQRRLMEISGYQVFSILAGNGRIRLNLSGISLDAVVLDYSSSFESRWALVRWLKLNYPSLPVIALRRDNFDEPLTLADSNARAQNPAEWLDALSSALTT